MASIQSCFKKTVVVIMSNACTVYVRNQSYEAFPARIIMGFVDQALLLCSCSDYHQHLTCSELSYAASIQLGP